MRAILNGFKSVLYVYGALWLPLFALAGFLCLPALLSADLYEGRDFVGIGMPETPGYLRDLASQGHARFAQGEYSGLQIDVRKFALEEGSEFAGTWRAFGDLGRGEKRLLDFIKSAAVLAGKPVFPDWEGRELFLDSNITVWGRRMSPVYGTLAIYDRAGPSIYCVKFGY